MIRVKICCISSVEEAHLAIRYGASALGFVSEMPSGPGVIPEDLIADIGVTVPPPVGKFLLTSRTDIEEIIAQQKRCMVNTVQICDSLPPGTHERLRKSLPGIYLVQVIHIVDRGSVTEAIEVAQNVDALLLDSGNQMLPVKELGGTGRIHDWLLSNEIVKKSGVPVFLAGGLNATNIRKAIQVVQPFGVDVCTGVRTDGVLDEHKLIQFMGAVSSAN